MPAINPDRLKKQIKLLEKNFNNPAEFVFQLRTLFEFYENHILRTGQSGSPKPLIQSYNIPKPVLRQIVQEITPNITQDPDTALVICNLLWGINYLETQQLSATMLGRIPVPPSDKVITKANQWLQKNTDTQVLNYIIEDGFENMRENDLPTLFIHIEDWLNSNDTFYIRIGINSLLPIIQNENLDNLPIIFRLLRRLICNIPEDISPDIITTLKALIKTSPEETAFFLESNLRTINCKDAAWIIRRLRKQFSPEIQKELRNELSRKRTQR